jgi:hypothetical protein
MTRETERKEERSREALRTDNLPKASPLPKHTHLWKEHALRLLRKPAEALPFRPCNTIKNNQKMTRGSEATQSKRDFDILFSEPLFGHENSFLENR